MADRVDRMVPVPYSALITSTPSTPMTSWLKNSPVRLIRVGSNVNRSTSDNECQLFDRAMIAMMPIPTVMTAMAPRLHIVERTVRSLTHSERSTLGTRMCRASLPGVVRVSAMSALLS